MKSFSKHVLAPAFDVDGVSLVEASAGTGKTYSIQTLFLRLVVAHGIPVQELLVVTFTEAATKELRERLRGILEKCRRQAEPGQALPDNDPDRHRIAEALALPVVREAGPVDSGRDLDDDTLRARRIRRALLDFDQAAIFTIHGFCQRALQEFAFECSHDFDAEVIGGDVLLRELCMDWWRRVRYGDAADFTVRLCADDFPDAGKLLRLMTTYLKRPGAVLLPEHDPAAQVASTAQVTELLDEAVGYAVSHAAAITAALETAEAARFFTDADRDDIRECLDALCAADGDRAAANAYLQRVAEALRPGPIPNPFALPPEVLQCVTACEACLAMARAHEMPTSGNSWGTPDAVATEWARTLGAACTGVKEHEQAIRDTAAVIEVNPDAFNKTDFGDPVKREKRLAALLEGASVSQVRTALKAVTKLKAKAKINWHSPEEVRELLAGVARIGGAAGRLRYVALGAGMAAVAAQYDQRKREEHGMTFDDMLVRLQKALHDEKTAKRLRGALRQRYRAALVDEFQDTDPVQYGIFEALFADGATPLFLVGDPKQAIYSFRGGDIFTYCAAKKGVDEDRRYSLDRNYRSQVPLVDAVNAVFHDRDGASLFGRADIPYAVDLACNGLGTCFVDEGVVDTRPFKIWDYANSGGRNPSGCTSGEARFIYAAVAAEVVRLLSSKATGFGPGERARGGKVSARDTRRLRPSDIAILVRRHAEAAFLYRELRRRGVPVVRQAGDNVFDSPEAAELMYVLQAMVNPGRVSAVKTALASTLLPVADDELVRLAREETVVSGAAAGLGIDGFPDSIDGWMVLFREAMDLWNRFGFSVAVNLLIERTGMQAWLASRPGGERCMVNLTQLQDLLHRAALEQHLGPDALLGWYQRQLDAGTREQNDAFETRLESDADAVQIMTIFKSKGLEFPVVFVPTMWTGMAGTRMAVCRVYHPDGESQSPVCLHLDMQDQEATDQAKEERRQEDVRNLYVAVTRASHRTYVVGGDGLGKKDSTLACCLPRDRLDEWAQDAGAAIDVIERQLEPSERTPWSPATSPGGVTLSVAGEAVVDKSRGHASFSSIAPHGAWHGGGEAYDFDADDTVGVDPAAETGALTAFSFPAGARTGECWHRIFEVLDFDAQAGTIRSVVNEQLSLFRLDKGDEAEKQAKRDVTFNMVCAVLGARLAVEGGHVRLADVKRECKRPEMAFDFSLRASGEQGGSGPARNAIWTTLNNAWGNAAGEQALFLERLQAWDRTIPGGFMTGFIDLFFEHAGRYYVLDWKSNRLGGTPESFDRDKGIVREMAEHAYFLQYLVYTVAAHGYLRQCLGSAYDYEQHFGGVLYLFVRGIGAGGDGQRGVYYTKPPVELVEQLTAALMAGSDHEG